MKLGYSIFSAILIATLSQPALACMCYSELQKEEALQKSETVFLAKVLSTDATSVTIPANPEYNEPARQIPASKYTLATVAQFKGNNQANFEILSRRTSCFVDLKPGREYVVYLRAGKNGNPPEIGTCDRIIPSENGHEDLEYLQQR